MVNFNSVDGKVTDVSNDVMADLSTDQLCLLKACLAIHIGIPCHFQGVERFIKDLSATTLPVVGHKSCHGMVIQCMKSKAELPKVDCKSDFL